MDPNFENSVANGMRVAIQTFGTDFTFFDGKTYCGVQSDNSSSFDLQAGGFLADYRFSLYCMKEDFSRVPTVADIGKELIVTGITYRILRIVTSEGDPGFQLDCGGPDK